MNVYEVWYVTPEETVYPIMDVAGRPVRYATREAAERAVVLNNSRYREKIEKYTIHTIPLGGLFRWTVLHLLDNGELGVLRNERGSMATFLTREAAEEAVRRYNRDNYTPLRDYYFQCNRMEMP